MPDEKEMWHSPIWDDCSSEEQDFIVEKIGRPSVTYQKGEFLWQVGDKVPGIGLILCGEVFITAEDLDGRRNVLAKLKTGDLAGEVFAISDTPSSVTVTAEKETKALYLDISFLYKEEWGENPVLRKFHWNFVRLLAQKTAYLNQKVQCMGQRSIREKVSHYLHFRQKVSGVNPFPIPLNREELADYLGVDRSALSYVLSTMAKEGLITYRKNVFFLCKI